jgi:hypothetical protein
MCARCKKQPRSDKTYCKDCRAGISRDRYRNHGKPILDETQRVVDRARIYASEYIRRGLRGMKRAECCEMPDCTAKPHIYHKDTAKPLEISWLCQPHAIELGLFQRKKDRPAVPQ